MTPKKRKGFISEGLQGIVGKPSKLQPNTPTDSPKPTPKTKTKPKSKKIVERLSSEHLTALSYDPKPYFDQSEKHHENFCIHSSKLQISTDLVTPKNKATRSKPFMVNFFKQKYHLVFVSSTNSKHVHKIDDFMYEQFLYSLYETLLQRGSALREKKFNPNELVRISESIDKWINSGKVNGHYFLLEKSEANQKHQRTINLTKSKSCA